MNKLVILLATFATTSSCFAYADPVCSGTTLTGIVRDSTLALIPGATVTLDGGRVATTGADGRFSFPCVANGTHKLAAAAAGFSSLNDTTAVPHPAALALTLQPQEVETNVEVSGDSPAGDPASNGPTSAISGSRLQSLADDPDDLLRELQQLAAASGGNPANTTISVDGFQGTSALPPKSSIAYIKIDPDMFSSEYREPPFDGGRVEVYTKPGQPAIHGALFATNGSPWENARDPFSVSKAALGKQRYGFELSGPIRKQGSDFALTLEHRSIDNFAVVNAVTLDNSGNQVNTVANVATPQRLWLGSARLDWQLGAKNTFITSYTARADSLLNVGVGGSSLADTGYASGSYEHTLRFTDVTTVSAHLMHEARASIKWDGETDTPASNAPQVQVAGAFTKGGSTLGNQRLGEVNLEVDDDAILTTAKHALKMGTQFFVFRENQQLPTNFNGTYVFGGGTAPVLGGNGTPVAGQTMTITGLEQYRRSLLGLAGGSATAYSNVTGTPQVSFTSVSNALFIQDDWNVGHGVHISSGLRYYIQNDPTFAGSLTPRAGILWSPDKKGTWTLHAHAGLFSGRFGTDDYSTVMRQDGTARVTSTVYNPNFQNPLAGATPIHSLRTFARGVQPLNYAIENIGGTRALPHGWNLSADLYYGRLWNYQRSENINSPLNGVPSGPRPGAQNLDIFQVQDSGQGRADIVFMGVENHSMKRVQLFVGAVHIDLIADTDDMLTSSPQNTGSDAGEYARRSSQPAWNVFGNGTVHLPYKVDLSGDLNASGDAHYNITTGFDNNGDGNFNDRPQYAAAGTPGAIPTQYGLLVASGGAGVFPRNKGVMPWTIHLDTNLQRTFKITRNAKAEHQQTLTANIRSSNVLNHLNVTSVGGVLGSPLFGTAYAADNGRRVEGGLRYSF